MIFYESPYRLVRTLTQFAEVFGSDRMVSVSRELTKKFEENVRGTLSDVLVRFTEREPKGEIVIVLCGRPRKGDARRAANENDISTEEEQ